MRVMPNDMSPDTRAGAETADAQFLGGLRVVLVGTSEAGNIGGAARAMKTMGLSKLTLVNPAEFPSAKATARASGADDVLSRATVVGGLDAALVGCGLVMGASARLRDLPWPLLGPRQAAQEAWRHRHARDATALVFGRESSGLSNDELERCHFQIHIPAADAYRSLNLAASVQLIAYEMRMAWLAARAAQSEAGAAAGRPPEALAGAEEMARFYDHLFGVMRQVGYYDPRKPKLLHRARRLFNRALMTRSEAQIMRGFLRMIEDKIN